MAIKSYKAVLFDMDGVIFDSEQLYMRCWEALSDTYDLPGIRDVLIRCIGVNAPRTREIFTETYGPDFPYDEAMAAAGKVWTASLVDGKLPLKPGAGELLSALYEAGIPIAIASSTKTDLVTRELTDVDLAKYFTSITGGDKVEKSKPEPDIFLQAMMDLSAASVMKLDFTGVGAFTASGPIFPNDCMVVEDSFNGIRAAHAAGMRPIMVPDILEPTEEIRALTEAVLPDLLAVKEYLLGE